MNAPVKAIRATRTRASAGVAAVRPSPQGMLGGAMLALLLAVAPAHAADPVPAKGSAPAKSGTLGKAPGQAAAAPSASPTLAEPMLTREELRQCLRQEDELKAGNGRLVTAQSTLDAEGKELAQAEAALKAEREGIDATSAEAVAAFNARLAALRERGEAYRSRALAFNEEVTAHQTRHKAWAGDCGSRSYNEIDYFAIQRGK